MGKVKVSESVNYLIEYEEFNGLTFIHCTIKTQWSKFVKYELQRDFDILLTLHGGVLFALHDPNDTKHQKFLEMFGFKLFGDGTNIDGQHRQVFVTGNYYG
jgi:hypothetical protein